jgi:tetratricopeptide (TPR) repeat protein
MNVHTSDAIRRRATFVGVLLTLGAGLVGAPGVAHAWQNDTPGAAPRATVREFQRVFPTYPFGDPNPIPVVGRIYPYFRFDGFSAKSVEKSWKVVELENAYIKVWILPEIGGKIWNAVEKKTGKSFIYFNEAVKFRDIAMRGPWTSGGIEANYGIIGHTPNVATPVDYVTKENADGSVSCTIGALDLLTRTPWRLEIRLGKDDAAFSTTSFWYNASSVEQPYYSWMNAGIKVDGKLQYIYPGTSYLGHAGEHGPWPIDASGRDLSWYDNNNFGGYKSYHVFGRETDFVGAYWHNDDYGMVRYGARDEKAGKKIWIWGLSRQGMIWTDLLTDKNGQYSEVQSGRLFNQSAEGSTFTPFKHRGFAPHTADRWTEYWYPVVGTKGFVAASRVGALNVTGTGDRLVLTLSPVVPVNDSLIVTAAGRRVAARLVQRAPLALWSDTISLGGAPRDSVTITLGGDLLTYAVDQKVNDLARPLDTPATFDWSSAYGQWTRGKEWIRQREYEAAKISLDSALLKDPNYVPALGDRAMLAVRSGDYAAARKFAMTALAVDSYDAAANYYYGIANRRLGRLTDAKDGFEIAVLSAEFRGAAWTELAKMTLAQGSARGALAYAQKALTDDAANLDALGVAVAGSRQLGDTSARSSYLARLESVDPLSHQARAERLLAARDAAFGAKLLSGVRAELPDQVLIELAGWYVDVGDVGTAQKVLEALGDHAGALTLRAALAPAADAAALLQRADAQSPAFLFPFRPEVIPAFQKAVKGSQSWKPKYYLALTYWSLGRLASADSLFKAVGDTPDYAPFYAARATFPWRAAHLARADLERAAKLDPSEWRYGKLLSEMALANGDALTAIAWAHAYASRFPTQYLLDVALAKAYLAAKQYAEADAVLATLEVLPHEGARDERGMYREAKLRLAEEAIGKKQWDAAEKLIADARLWPERLGAGKPYDADLDERWEDSLSTVVKQRGATAASKADSAPRVGKSFEVSTASWEADSLGNHRAAVMVESASDAVVARIEWRRRDKTPDAVNVIVTEEPSGRRILNVARVRITRDSGEIVFQAPSAGMYRIYYLPYTGTFKSNYPKITYRAVEATADSRWLSRNGLTGKVIQTASLPQAKFVAFDAINDFSKFTEMEYIATDAERRAVIAKEPSAAWLAFAEDRKNSIRMMDDIPGTWARRGAFQSFTGAAQRGEFYSWQLGVWAHKDAVDSLRYKATAFKQKGGTGSIPASAISSINFEGTDWSGARFSKPLHVDKGKVQALWFGADIPTSAAPGDYEGKITLMSKGGVSRDIGITLRVGKEVAVNHGDDKPADLTRLRWLNSQLAADDSVVKPYTALKVAGTTISLLGRSFTFGNDGFPTSIKSYFSPNNTSIGTTSREILNAPARLHMTDAEGKDIAWTGAAPTITKRAQGAVAWETRKTAGALSMHTKAQLEFDGTAEYTVAVKAGKSTTLKNVSFELPINAAAAKYMMGLGQKGGFRPADFHWTWDVAKKNQDAAWIGDVNAGVQFTLKDEHYVRPLNTNFYLSKPLIAPRSWANDGKGGCDITQSGERVLVNCYSGTHTIAAGDSLRFDFRLMITPFKTLDTKGQWETRYFHAFVPVDSAAARGANTMNVHHANRVNPWINYPFIETAGMRAYIDSSHAKGMKTKIYYTVRELTNHSPEIFALRSLGDEVLSHGPGGGYSWLQEHIGDDYIAAWHVPAIKDAAIVNSGVSRWHNFYIEGLNWLVKNEKIDGLYLDDVAFDRLTMKRVRKVLDRGNDGALIDLHSANQYNKNDGFSSSANLYLEHFPFINRLWFGEYFDYNSKPDYWLVEISGIPFGLMGEMLQDGGNPWRGLTMGMTARLPWSGDPSPIWKLWDSFGVQSSTLNGWWSGADPVRTSDAEVLATTWSKPHSAMIALGSWHEADTKVTLTVDWQKLGIDPARARFRAPAIANFQEGGNWLPGAAITVPGKKGLVLIVEER